MAHPDDPFFRVYTAAERAEAAASADPLYYYAERFAAKEAVFKALGLDGDHARLNEIETLHGACGRPEVHLYGAIREHALHAGVTAVHISLSGDAPFVIACAVSERTP